MQYWPGILPLGRQLEYRQKTQQTLFKQWCNLKIARLAWYLAFLWLTVQPIFQAPPIVLFGLPCIIAFWRPQQKSVACPALSKAASSSPKSTTKPQAIIKPG